MDKKAVVFLAQGFEEIEALCPIDILRRAGVEVLVLSTTGQKEVAGARGVTVVADDVFSKELMAGTDAIVLPGGMPGAQNLNQYAPLRDILIDFRNSKKIIGAICAAPMVLGNAGVLRGKKATCYPGYEEDLFGADVVDEAVVYDKNVVTARGVGAAIEFSLKLVEVLCSKELADELAEKMVVV